MDSSKLGVEKFADGGIACWKLAGVIDEAFDGKKLAEGVSAETLVIDLGGVKKISSFGIREWVDFVGTASKHVKALYLIECAPKVVDQLNMVANFAGSGLVYSFYAPFRCDYCDSEHRVLLQIDKDHEAIRSMKLADRPCPKCKESMYFDDEGSTFFSYLRNQEKVSLPAAVAQFLASRLDYAVGDQDHKLRVDKVIDGRVTYLRLAGNLDRSFPREKLADGLEGLVVIDLASVGRIEPAGAAEWRGFVALATPVVEALVLAAVPPAFLEKLGSRDDLGAKGQIVTLTLPYECRSCATTAGQLVNVAEHHAVLKFATAPELRCPSCQAAMQCVASETSMAQLATLPKPTVPVEIASAIGGWRERAIAPKRPTPVPTPPPVVTPTFATAPPKTNWLVPFLAALLAVVLAATGFLIYQRLTTKRVTPDAVTDRSAPARPAWIVDEPCVATAAGGLSCTGKATSVLRDEAEAEATEAAYDVLAMAIATRLSASTAGKQWSAVVPAVYQSARAAKLAAFDRDPTATAAHRDVREARQGVMRALKATGRGVPAAPSDRYWEQLGEGDRKRFVAHAQLVVGKSELAALVEQYGRANSAIGAVVVTAFPLVAWRHPALDHGALVLDLAPGLLQDLGLDKGFVILSISGREIADAAAFETIATEEGAKLSARGGTLRLQVQTTEAKPRELTREVPPPTPTKPDTTATTPNKPRQPGSSSTVGTGNVNIWDRTGGNRGSGSAGSGGAK